MKNACKMVLDNWPKIKVSLDKLTSREVLVGIPQDTNQRKEVGANNASLGYIHDQGSPAANIPARPFMDPGVREVQSTIVETLGKAAKASLHRDDAALDVGLNKAGLLAQNSIRSKVNSGIEPELAESTLVARRRRGRSGTKPLIDTGQLRNSITYVIRNRHG